MLNQHYNTSFYHLVSTLKNANNKNIEILFFKTRYNHNKILNLLLKEGYILSYKNYDGFILIKLNLIGSKQATKFNRLFINVESNIRLKQKNKTILLKELSILQKREGRLSYYIINTDKGLLTSFDAINKRVGGKILLKIT